MYLASNGGEKFMGDVQKHIQRINPLAQMFTKVDVVQRDDGAMSAKCQREMRDNNFLLYSVEKVLLNKATIHFNVNPKYDWVFESGFMAFTKSGSAFNVTVPAVLEFATKMKSEKMNI